MSELMSDAINLMLVGMGFVYVFLMILVFITSIMSKLVAHFAPEVPDASVNNTDINNTNVTNTSPGTPSTASEELKLVAVMSAALAKYRSQHQK